MNTSEDFLSALSRAKRALLTTHVRPDGDALGSTAALALALKSRGIHADILLLSHLPTKYRFVFEESGLTHFDAERGSSLPDYASYDTLIVADTGTYSQLPGLEPVIPSFKGQILIIDHHKTQEPWGNVRLVDTTASSACELVCHTLQLWGIELTKEIASVIYVGMVSDTGWFQFSNTTPTTLRLAATLMEAGVVPDAIYQRLYQSEREARIKLQARAMSSLKVLANGKLAIMQITGADFTETNASVPDTENVINLPLQIGTVEMSILFTQPPEGGPIRISCRSKGKVDVAKFAETFGGGGHARASGLKIADTLPNAIEKVTALATSALAAL